MFCSFWWFSLICPRLNYRTHTWNVRILLELILLVLIPGSHGAETYQTQQGYQSAGGYGSPGVGSRPLQTLMSKNVCRGRTGYVADTSRNCQVFYNCLPDGTITTSTCPGTYQFDETTQCCKMPHDVNCAGLISGGGGLIRPTISCTGKRGFYPDLPSGCRIFFFCEPSGRSRQLNCPDGLLFNEMIGCCDIAENVRCGNHQLPVATSPVSVDGEGAFCRNRRPGFFTNPSDCSTYYYCRSDGHHNFLRCPTGQAFNEQTSSCDNDLSQCYGVQVDRNVFDCSGRNGWYQANDLACRYAFYCNAGLGYMHSCPGGLRWNPFTLSCDEVENVPCRGQTGDGNVISGHNGGASPSPAPAQYGGGYGQPPDVNNRPPIAPFTIKPLPQTTRNVPNGYGIMTQPPYGDYAHTTRLPWNGNGIQTYPSVNLVTTSQSGSLARVTSQYIMSTNPGLGIDNNYDCRGKIGYYAVEETACSQFIYCNPEGIAHRFACPSTLVFNNSLAVCDWPQNVRCHNQVVPGFLPNSQNEPNFDCRGKDGFYADQVRGGRIFYMCHSDGAKYQYVCPSNLVFNERNAVCDWPDYMKEGGFTPGPQTGTSAGALTEWNEPALDCRTRPAGFYANPSNNQVYARCTPDGTFLAMPCPKATVFDQGLGLCVFPYQVGQAQNQQVNSPQQVVNHPQDVNEVDTGTGHEQQQNGYFGGGWAGAYQGAGLEEQTGGQTGTQPYQAGGRADGQDLQTTQLERGSAFQAGQYGGQEYQTGQWESGQQNVGGGHTSGQEYQTVRPQVQVQQTGRPAAGQAYQTGRPPHGQLQYGVTTPTVYTAQLRPYVPQNRPQPPPLTTPNYGPERYTTEGNGFQGNFPPYSYGRPQPLVPFVQNSVDTGEYSQGEEYGRHNNLGEYYQQEQGFGQQQGGANQGGSSGSSVQGGGGNQQIAGGSYVQQSGGYQQTGGAAYFEQYGRGFYGQMNGGYQGGGSGLRTPQNGGLLQAQQNNGNQNAEEWSGALQGGSYTGQNGGQQQRQTEGWSFSNQNNGNQDSATGSYVVQNGETGGYQPHTGEFGNQNIVHGGSNVNTRPHPGYAHTPQQTLAVCLGQTGMHGDRASNCRRYAVCGTDGTGTMRMCEGGLVFNELIGECDSPINVNCFTNAPGIVQPAVPVCASGDFADTFVPDVAQGCTVFYNCEQNGRGTGFRCPTGMQFNIRINACDDPRNCNCVAGNGGTINIRIPVPTVVTGSPFAKYQMGAGHSENENQNMDLDIRVRRPVVRAGMLPLIPGYDGSMYADASGSHARLPTFFSDDDGLRNATAKTIAVLFNVTTDDPKFQAAAAEPDSVTVFTPSAATTIASNSIIQNSTTYPEKQEYFKLKTKSLKLPLESISGTVEGSYAQ